MKTKMPIDPSVSSIHSTTLIRPSEGQFHADFTLAVSARVDCDCHASYGNPGPSESEASVNSCSRSGMRPDLPRPDSSGVALAAPLPRSFTKNETVQDLKVFTQGLCVPPSEACCSLNTTA